MSAKSMSNETSTPTPSPLAEADPRSLDEWFSSKPPFSPSGLKAIVEEMRRMRAKWQVEEAEGVKKRSAKRAGKAVPQSTQDDLWGE